MSISISRIAITLALLATVLPAFATLSDRAASHSSVATAVSSAGSCQSYIDWNPEKRVWRMNCGDEASCCVYDSLRQPGGGIAVWCDCESDGIQPECCHAVLVTYPEDPRRRASPHSDGECSASCDAASWERACRFFVASRDAERGQQVAMCVEAL